MRRLTILSVIAIALCSCATLQEPITLGQVKSGLNCVQYKEGMTWDQVSQVMGSPDIAPIPEPGTGLSKNARIYKGTTFIFYTDLKEVKEEGKFRFQEVVINIEFCKNK